MRPIRIPFRSPAQQLSATALSRAADAGEVAPDLGHLQSRRLAPPTQRVAESRSIRFTWPAATVPIGRRA